MKWYVKYGYSNISEDKVSLQTLYAGNYKFMAWIVYKWCSLLHMKDGNNTIMMYNEAASDSVEEV